MRTCGSKGQRKYIENITIRLDATKARKDQEKRREKSCQRKKRTANENLNLNVSCVDIKLQIHSERGSENIVTVVA